MNGPTITVIGAGSFFFGRKIIWKCATSPIMNGGTLNLVDIDTSVLETMKKNAESAFAASENDITLNATTNYRDVLPDSDFIVLTFSDQNAHYRGIDTEIAKKHGITMCSSDTIGPGGIFRAMREIPKAVEIARHAQEVAPNAWVINFINPTTVLGMALRRYAPDIRSFALCDGLHEPYKTLNMCKQAGIIDADATDIAPEIMAKTDLRIGGVNHFTWLLKFEYEGKDMTPILHDKLVETVKKEAKEPGEKAKGRFNNAYILALFDLYGIMPMCIAHTKEYVPFFQGYGVAAPSPEPIICFDAPGRVERMAEDWKNSEAYASGEKTGKEFLENEKSDHASDIIESMWGNLGKPFYVNTANKGAVPNLPEEAFLECRSSLDMTGPTTQLAGDFPRGVLSMQYQVLDTHEMTAEAAMTGDRDLLLRAICTDPIVNNIEDGRNCIEDLLAAEKDALPDYWY